jgi:Fur family ferric uptake transcriptional regulator
MSTLSTNTSKTTNDRTKGRSLDSDAQLKKIVRDLGLKITAQRLTILAHITSSKEHFTAQQIFEELAETAPDMGFATVYRFLKMLSEHKYVTEVRTRGLPARYEWAAKEHHDHLTCTSCGKICEFENEKIEDLQKQIARELGFELTDHILELFGICSDCRLEKRGETLPNLNVKN